MVGAPTASLENVVLREVVDEPRRPLEPTEAAKLSTLDAATANLEDLPDDCPGRSCLPPGGREPASVAAAPAQKALSASLRVLERRADGLAADQRIVDLFAGNRDDIGYIRRRRSRPHLQNTPSRQVVDHR